MAASGLASSAWPKISYDTNNTGLSPFIGSQAPTLKWQSSIQGADFASPVIGPDGTIYIGSYSGGLSAIAPNGTKLWSGPGTTYSVAIGADGTIYTGDQNLVYALSSAGVQKWSNDLNNDGGPNGHFTIGPDGTIYVMDQGGCLNALTSTGTLKWQDSNSGNGYSGNDRLPAVGPDGTIYFGNGWNGGVTALTSDDRQIWQVSLDGNTIDGATAIGSDGTLYVASSGGNIYALNPSDGSIKWTYNDGGDTYTYGALARSADGTIYAGSDQGNLIALNSDGSQKWSYSTGSEIDAFPAIGADGTVYFTNLNGNFYALNPDGSLKWTYSIGDNTCQSSPAIGTDGTTYFADGNWIYAFTGTVNFTANKTGGTPPLTVQFTGSSPLSVTSWNWNFGDGSTSTLQCPSHTYTSAGAYAVNLSVTSSTGTDYLVQPGYITVTSNPLNAAFLENITSGPYPLAVNFTDNSTGSPTSWLWNFGDGTTAITQNPTHTYTSMGNYSVNLTVSNSGGSNTSRYQSISVSTPTIPAAFFTVTQRVGIAPVTVRFTDASRYLPTNWNWSFGDGSYSSLQNPTHTYTAAGTYTVSLNASNSAGSGTNTTTNYMAIMASQQPISAQDNVDVYVANPEGVKYDVPNGVWNLGTYPYQPNTYFLNLQGGTNPFHISSISNAYSAADTNTTTSQSGSFWITFSGGQTTMPDAILMLAVNGTIPNDFAVNIQSSGQTFNVGSPATTNQAGTPASTFVPVGINETFTKNDFIYGTQGWKPCSSSNYPLNPDNTNTTDPTNNFQIMFIDLRVGAVQNSTASLTNNGMVQVKYRFTNLQSTAVFNGYGWYMQCNHGTGAPMTNAIPGGGGVVVIGTSAPVASFTANTTYGAGPLAVQFTDTSANSPTGWSWTFGDGSTSTQQSPEHTYTSAGTYTVTLTATNAQGSNTATETGYVTVTQPLPSYNKIFVTVANTAGVKYNYFSNDTYNINFNGATSGLNALHISTDPTTTGQTTVTGSQSGTFYVTDSGGKGYEDDIILMVAVNGTIPNNFGLTLNSDGYTWTPNPASNAAPTAETYQSSGLSETFTKNDFIYGPQIWKPTGSASYPIYAGQDMTNATNTFQLMFVDLNSGVLHPDTSLMNDGAVRINYAFQNLAGTAVFNAYAYCQNTNAGNQMIGWTNSLTTSPVSGYMVTSGSSSSTAPTAAFAANMTRGTSPLAVQFTDASANSPTGWSWNFGDGSTSSVQNPSHTYTTAGTYTVNLTATNTAGSNTLSKTGYISVTGSSGSGPVPAFIAMPVNGIAPLTVQFADQSTGSPAGWSWNFGDGSTSSAQNPSHTYTTAGTYTVNLTATNTAGSNTLSKIGIVYVTSSTGPVPGYNNTYIRMANHEGVLYNSNNNGTYYAEAGGSNGGLNILHISTAPTVPDGQVTVSRSQSGTIYATSSGTYADDAILMLAVNGTIPNDFAVNVKSSGYTWAPTGSTPASVTYQSSALGETFTKNDLSYGPQNWKPTQGNPAYPLFYGEDMNSSVNQYQVMFIDLRTGIPGTGYSGYSSLTNQGAARIDYSFTDLPAYAAFNVYGWKSGAGMGWTNQLTGTGSSGYMVISPSLTIPPVASFTASPSVGLAPVNVKFMDTSANTPTSWSWNFGDGNTSTSQNPAHMYSSAGTYTVVLSAANSAGSNTITQVGAVTVSAPVINTTACTVSNIQTTTSGTTQSVSVNTTGITATMAGNFVNLTGLSGSWENLSIALTSPAVTSGGNLTGTVSSVQAVMQPVTIPLSSLGNPNVTMSLSMTQVPASGSTVTGTISSSPSTSTSSSFTAAATGAGDQINAIAYTVTYAKTGIADKADGGIISSATITMAISPSWVAANGGTSHIVILHQTDGGTSTLLTTQFAGTDAEGNDLFTAVSPTGLSVFSLASISSISSGISSPGSSSFDTSSSSFTSTSFALTASGVAAGQSMNFAVNEGLNGNLNYGISSVSIMPSKALGSTELTVSDAGMSMASLLPNRQVAGVVQIEPVGVNPSSISSGTITFQISGTWMTSHSLTPDDIVLLHDVNGQWTELPTTFVSQSGSTYTFSAITPGFSYFAIAGRLATGTATAATAVPTTAALQAAVTTVPTSMPFTYVLTPYQTTAVPAAMEAAPAQATTTSVASGSGLPLIGIIAAIVGIVLLVAGVVLVRRWWIRRQNPALFRKYD